ncbi:MAG: MBL fold metallo-hydrolase, partial [Candidatus Odinarchaeia archaeon]
MVTYNVDENIICVANHFNDDIGYSNSFIYFINKSVVIIDSGLNGLYKEIVKAIKNRGRSIKDVKYLILTHAHPYVTGNLNQILKKSKCEILASSKTASILENYNEVLTLCYGLDKRYNLYFKKKKLGPFFKSIKVDKIMKNKEKFKVDGLTLIFIESDGHCEGHLNIWEPENRILIAGGELISYPNNYANFIIDRTGSFSSRLYNLELILELNPKILCSTHDI